MSLFPESWITKYEMLHQATKPIQSKDPLFIRKENGVVETKFLMAPLEKKDVTVFPTQIAMLQPVSYVGKSWLRVFRPFTFSLANHSSSYSIVVVSLVLYLLFPSIIFRMGG